MRFLIFSTLLLHCSIMALDLKNIESLENWKVLKEKPIKVEWREYKNFPISKAEITLTHTIEKIASIIQDVDNYPTIFERVTNTRHLDENVVQIILDMPFPFSGRDYIVEYFIENSQNHWVFSFTSVKHSKGIIEPDHVRLPNASGIWILKRLGPKRTKVIYGWNGELLGNFPEFGLEQAWITQGTEVLSWLEKTLSNKE